MSVSMHAPPDLRDPQTTPRPQQVHRACRKGQTASLLPTYQVL